MSVLMSVIGQIPADDPGLMLPHEHIMSKFGGDPVQQAEYDEHALFSAIVPYLQKLRGLGCTAIADCTSAYIGRRPDLLRRVSEKSGVVILTNTGWYGASGGRYLPPEIGELSVDAIFHSWKAEWEGGIGQTGIRPGFIKTAIDGNHLTAVDRKLMTAAARLHGVSGMPIQTHTGNNPKAAEEILDLLTSEGVGADAWIWVHAHYVLEPIYLVRAARRGAWISLDGVHPQRSDLILSLCRALRQEGLLGRVLLSHDGNAYTADGACRPFDFLMTGFIPRLMKEGFSTAEVNALTAANPRRALSIR